MQEDLTPESSMSFVEKMAGGAFVCEAHDDHKLIFVNDNLISLFECGSRYPDKKGSHPSGSESLVLQERPRPHGPLQEICR